LFDLFKQVANPTGTNGQPKNVGYKFCCTFDRDVLSDTQVSYQRLNPRAIAYRCNNALGESCRVFMPALALDLINTMFRDYRLYWRDVDNLPAAHHLCLITGEVFAATNTVIGAMAENNIGIIAHF